MSENIQYVTLAYGPEAEWRPMLERWLVEFERVLGREADLAIVSAGEPWVAEVVEARQKRGLWTLLREHEVPPGQVRGRLNISGILLAEAAIELAPCLVVTLDCEILRAPVWGPWMAADIALGKDHYIPGGQRHTLAGRQILEHNCAVQWCGANYIGELFHRRWREHLHDPRAWTIGCWEQVIWSLVFDGIERDGAAELYPQVMNWSAGVPAGDADVVFRHYHGNRKKLLWKKWGLFQ